MFQHVTIECPRLAEIGARFLDSAEFYSVFFGPEAPSWHPNFSRGFQAVLGDALQSDFLGKAVHRLLPLDLRAARKCTILNRYEFEGSLIGALLQGTCTDSVVGDEREAREAVDAILSCILTPKGVLCGFRMDDPAWSALTVGATLSWSFFAYESSQKLWWFTCLADFY